jgi:hypothetical protein
MSEFSMLDQIYESTTVIITVTITITMKSGNLFIYFHVALLSDCEWVFLCAHVDVYIVLMK